MGQAFMPAGYQNDNYTMRQAGNPYFLPEPQDLYVTQPANMWEGSNPMTWQDYGQQMANDYGAGAQKPAPAAPAKPSTTMDYSKWLSGDIWNTRVRNASGKDWSERLLGDVGSGLSYGNFDNYSRYAPPKPGEGATQEDWRNYREANNLWNQGLSNVGSSGNLGGYGVGKKRLDKLDMSTVNWDHLYKGWNNSPEPYDDGGG
jgi:hypothetical protein